MRRRRPNSRIRAGQDLTALAALCARECRGHGHRPADRNLHRPQGDQMGDVTVEVLHLGPAHSPGDTQVWIPQWSMMIAGDIAFHERMPPIFEGTCTSVLDRDLGDGLRAAEPHLCDPRPRASDQPCAGDALYPRLCRRPPRMEVGPRSAAYRGGRRSGRGLLRRPVAVGAPGHVRGTGHQERRGGLFRDGVRIAPQAVATAFHRFKNTGAHLDRPDRPGNR
jgi:hypothetical protein